MSTPQNHPVAVVNSPAAPYLNGARGDDAKLIDKHSTLDTEVPSNALGIIQLLCQRLEDEQVSYCHWKSNEAIARSASGENDLDLLVRRQSASNFERILIDLGFKEVWPSRSQPAGVLSYYGHDDRTGRLVHVHVHYRLVFGHDATKSYSLPIERAYVESAARRGVFRIPSAEFELTVFVLRMTLKHAGLDAVLTGQWRLSRTEIAELQYLNERATPFGVTQILRAHVPQLPPGHFERSWQLLLAGPTSWRRNRSARDIRKALADTRTLGETAGFIKRVTHLVSQVLRRRLKLHKTKKRFARGGKLIAIVGGDGAGKSTAIDAMHAWLNKDFEIHRVHLGKPLSATLQTLLALPSRLLGRRRTKKSTVPNRERRQSESGRYSYTKAFVDLMVARSRYQTYIKARRWVANGDLVVSDRWPIRGLTSMDAPRIRMDNTSGALMRTLARLEDSYYERILPPDLLIVLKLPPEIAVERRPDEPAHFVHRRSSAVSSFDWQAVGAEVIDASKPKTAVLREIQSLVWRSV